MPYATLLLLAFAGAAFVGLEVVPDPAPGSSLPAAGSLGDGMPFIDHSADAGAAPASVGRRVGEDPTSAPQRASVWPPDDAWAGPDVDAWKRRRHAEPLAQVGGVHLFAPVVDPIVAGYHEASTDRALAMQPLGPLLANHNTTRYTPRGAGSGDAVAYVVLSSRGRAAGPTSAVDVVAHPGHPIVAPITGDVTDVRSYTLYGRHPDQRVEIRSRHDPSLRVVVVHVSDVGVRVGDRVIGGWTPIAGTATVFPFASQIDRETDPYRYPHVHIEVQSFDARRPGDG